MSPIKMERILVPTDFSDQSQKAFLYAVEMARLFEAEIVLLHVFDQRVVNDVFHIHQLPPEEARQEMLRRAEERMETFSILDEAKGIPLRTRFEEGIPPQVVQETAEEIEADLIVIGTHGETGLTHLLYGTTAEGVVRGAPCPVLTVNP
jgi:nucleotide-binding universal stress UspA family protein